jgi:hypothetical protein
MDGRIRFRSDKVTNMATWQVERLDVLFGCCTPTAVFFLYFYGWVDPGTGRFGDQLVSLIEAWSASRLFTNRKCVAPNRRIRRTTYPVPSLLLLLVMDNKPLLLRIYHCCICISSTAAFGSEESRWNWEQNVHVDCALLVQRRMAETCRLMAQLLNKVASIPDRPKKTSMGIHTQREILQPDQ